MSERDAVFRGRMMVVDFRRVISEFHEFPQHVRFYWNTGYDGVRLQELKHKEPGTKFQMPELWQNRLTILWNNDYKSMCTNIYLINSCFFLYIYIDLNESYDHKKIDLQPNSNLLADQVLD